MGLFFLPLSCDMTGRVSSSPLPRDKDSFLDRAKVLGDHFKKFKKTKNGDIPSYSGQEQFRSTKSWFSFVLACTLDLGGGRVFDVRPTTGPGAVLEVAQIMDDHLQDSYIHEGDRITFDVMTGRIKGWAAGRSSTPVQRKMAIAWKRFQEVAKGPWAKVAKHYEVMSGQW